VARRPRHDNPECIFATPQAEHFIPRTERAHQRLLSHPNDWGRVVGKQEIENLAG